MSPIGFGAFKIGRNQRIRYPAGYELPDEEDAARLLGAVLDLGINLIDTAPAYGLSEERIGRAIGHRQEEYLVCTKAGETFEGGRSSYDYSPRAIRTGVERSLGRLRRKTIDILLVHSHGEDREVLDGAAVPDAMESLRSAGLVRWIGLSAATVAGARAALAWADVIMVEYSLRNMACAEVIEAAARCGVGVLVKKGLGSGRLDAAPAIRFVLSNPAVSSLIVGGLSIAHLQENVRAAEALARAAT